MLSPAPRLLLLKIKALPCLCEYNTNLLYLFISSSVLSLLIKSCENSVLKGFLACLGHLTSSSLRGVLSLKSDIIDIEQ